MSILETRFARLVRHFFAGFLNNDLLISSEAGFENALSQIIALIVAPGLFYGIFAFWKYGSLPDRIREMLAWEDMLLFTAFAIVLTGLLTVVEWDALFPDRRDYHVLTPLPLTTRLLFLAKLSSILLLLAIFWGAANLGPAFLFSVAVLPDGAPWFDLARRFAAHLIATTGAGACVFLFFFGLQGVLLNLLTPKWFRRVSVYIQLALVLVLALSFLVLPFVLYSGIRWIRGNEPWIYFLPPFWFLGLYQVLIGHGGPVFSPLAGLAVKALGSVAAVSALAYVASYNRHVKTCLESPETSRSGPGFFARAAAAALNRFVLKHPIERACFHFIGATLLRSGLHRLLLAAYVGLGFALVLVTAAVDAFQSGGARPTPGLLSVQLVLSFFVLCGMRFAFSLPAALRANWAFQATGPAARSRWGAGMRKAMLAFGVCPVLLVLLPLHSFLWGWTVALPHLLYGAALSVLLVELLLLTFDKIPFTCTYLPGKANVKALWPVYLVACWGYSYGMAKLEFGLFARPLLFALFCVAALAAITALRRYRRRRFGPGFRFLFEEAPEPAVRTLNIAFGSERDGVESSEPSAESSLTGDVPARFNEGKRPETERRPIGPAIRECASRIAGDLRIDLRYAFRTLAHNPGFTLAAAAILTVAISLNTSLFTFFSALALKPLPITERHRNVMLTATRANLQPHDSWSYPDFTQLRAQSRVFEEMYAWSEAELPLREPVRRRLKGVLVSGNFFRIFNAGIILGRAFGPEEGEVPGRDAVVVISHHAWRSIFHADPMIAGRTVRIRQTVFTVVGVTDPNFTGTDPLTVPDVWAPVAMRDQLVPQGGRLADSENAFLKVGGLLKPGLPLVQARDSVFGTVLGLNAQHPAASAIAKISLEARTRYIPLTGDVLVGIVCMFALLGLVLLIACANLAGILLARGAARQREIAIRASIGASRGRLIRQLLTESVLLAALAAVPGMLLTQASTGAMYRYFCTLLIQQGYTIQPVSPEWRVFVFAMALALGAGILLGLAPALEATRTNLAGRLKEAGAGTVGARPGKLRGMLVAGQVAASLVLLLLAGVFIQNAQRVSRIDTGLDVDHAIDVRADGLKGRLVERLRQDPRFRAAAEAYRTPLSGWPVFVPGKADGRVWPLGYNYVESGYFEALGMRVRRGRTFTAQEARAGAPVVMVAEATARLLWPHENPLGKTIEVLPPKGSERSGGKYEVIGVVADVLSGVLYLGKDYTSIYLPAPPDDPRNRSLIVRSTDVSRATLADIRNLCGEVEGLNGCEPRTLRDMVSEQRFPYAAASGVSSGIGLLALAMTCIGLYGVVAFAVVQRTREIGIRMALGAKPASVLRSMLGQGMRRVGLGIILGLPVCVALSKILARSVFAPGAVQTFGAGAYLLTPLCLAAVTLVAVYVPARRATRIDPMAALRHD